MDRINFLRVLIGGSVAGLVIIAGEYVLNGILLADQWSAMRAQYGIDFPDPGQFAAGALITLCYGMTLVWIYAAIRPRFGSGPKTILIAALTFWFIAYALFLTSLWANGLVNADVTIASIVWGLFEAPIAAFAGAWLYREKGQ